MFPCPLPVSVEWWVVTGQCVLLLAAGRVGVQGLGHPPPHLPTSATLQGPPVHLILHHILNTPQSYTDISERFIANHNVLQAKKVFFLENRSLTFFR